MYRQELTDLSCIYYYKAEEQRIKIKRLLDSMFPYLKEYVEAREEHDRNYVKYLELQDKLDNMEGSDE